MFYYEQANFKGDWTPVVVSDRPRVREINGVQRLKRTESIGPRVRAIRTVPKSYKHLTLMQLRNVLSPDGAFTQPARTGDRHG